MVPDTQTHTRTHAHTHTQTHTHTHRARVNKDDKALINIKIYTFYTAQLLPSVGGVGDLLRKRKKLT